MLKKVNQGGVVKTAKVVKFLSTFQIERTAKQGQSCRNTWNWLVFKHVIGFLFWSQVLG